MRYAARHRIQHTLDTIALTDIILNLFIFFFITFSIAYIPKTHTAVAVDLPRAGQGETAAPGPLVISLQSAHEDGVWIGERPVAQTNLAIEIRAIPEADRARGAFLRCDRQVPIERVLQVLDALKQSGLRDISVAAQPASSPGAAP